MKRVDVKTLRQKLGFSQSEFCARFGISIETLRTWEQRKREPQGPACVLLAVIAHAPQVVQDAVSAAA